MKRIILIEENNVEVTPSIKLFDTSGNEIEIWDNAKKTHYGQGRINDRRVKSDKKLTVAQNLDPKKYKADLITLRQKAVDKIQAMRAIIPSKIVIDVNDNEVEVFDTSKSEAYEELVGEILTDKRLLKEAKDLDPVKYKKDEITKTQKEVKEVNDIQKVMDS